MISTNENKIRNIKKEMPNMKQFSVKSTIKMLDTVQELCNVHRSL